MKRDKKEPIILDQNTASSTTPSSPNYKSSPCLRPSLRNSISSTNQTEVNVVAVAVSLEGNIHHQKNVGSSHKPEKSLNTQMEPEEGKEDIISRDRKEKEAMMMMTGSSGGWEIEAVEESGRERLKRHRGEVAGQVWIPDIWGQEDLLKDWIDCSAFHSVLVPSPTGIISARAALAEERRRSVLNSSSVTVENSC